VDNNHLTTDQLAQLIARKLDVLQHLRDLSQRQTQIISEGTTQQLMRVLSAKQTLMIELHKVQEQLTPYHDQTPQSRQWPSPQARQACREQVEHCETLLREIITIERRCETQLVNRRDAVEAQLQESHCSAAATRAYLQPQLPPRSTFDLSSDS